VVVLGYAHSCSHGTDGKGRFREKNDVGQLGNGGSDDSESSVRVAGLPRGQVVALRAGSCTTCAVLRSGGIMC